MGFFGVPWRMKSRRRRSSPPRATTAPQKEPVAHAAAHPTPRAPADEQGRRAVALQELRAGPGQASQAGRRRGIALAALPAPKAAAPQPARNAEDEGLVGSVEAPRRSYASR